LHVAFVQIVQVREVDIGLVEDDHFPRLQAGTQFASALVVVFARSVHDGKRQQRTRLPRMTTSQISELLTATWAAAQKTSA
jgi:hypothetical protein